MHAYQWKSHSLKTYNGRKYYRCVALNTCSESMVLSIDDCVQFCHKINHIKRKKTVKILAHLFAMWETENGEKKIALRCFYKRSQLSNSVLSRFYENFLSDDEQIAKIEVKNVAF